MKGRRAASPAIPPGGDTVRGDEPRRELADELVRLRKAVEASGEVVFLTDRRGTITYVNPEFLRLYGYDASEVVGLVTPRILKSGRSGRRHYEGLWHALLGKQVVRGEFVNRTKDGRLVTVESSANPIMDERGEIIGFLAIHVQVVRPDQQHDRFGTHPLEFSADGDTPQQILRGIASHAEIHSPHGCVVLLPHRAMGPTIGDGVAQKQDVDISLTGTSDKNPVLFIP